MGQGVGWRVYWILRLQEHSMVDRVAETMGIYHILEARNPIQGVGRAVPSEGPRAGPLLPPAPGGCQPPWGPWGPLSLLCLSVTLSLPCGSLASLSSAYKNTSHRRASPSQL